MEYTEEILKKLLQELTDKREYFYSDAVDYDNDAWREGVDKCDKEIKVVNNLLSLFIVVWQSEQLKCDCCDSLNTEVLKDGTKHCKDCDRLWAF
jgi:hypothetical protein